MRVFLTLRLSVCLLGLAFVAATSKAKAQTGSCADISKDVASAVEKDPAKVLMIVEDALVINESCACEIIKAAILASKADGSMVNQIVQTGISVAPKMSGIIMDCATAASPGTAITNKVTAVTPSGKESVKNPLPVAPTKEEDEFSQAPASIRGVYLIQPPSTGFVPCDPNFRKCENCPTSPTSVYP